MAELNFFCHPSTKKVYRHPVLLSSGKLDELREAQKREETEYIRFRELEEIIKKNPLLMADRYVSDKTSTEAVVDCVLLRKPLSRLYKYSSFSLTELSFAPLRSSTAHGVVNEGGSVWRHAYRTQTACAWKEEWYYLWKNMKIDLDTEEGKEALRRVVMMKFTIRYCDEMVEKILFILWDKLGSACQLIFEWNPKLLFCLSSPVTYLKTIAAGPFPLDVFTKTLLKKRDENVIFDLISFFFQRTPDFDFTKDGPEIMRCLTFKKTFWRLFSLIPEEERPKIVLGKEFFLSLVQQQGYPEIMQVVCAHNLWKWNKEEVLSCFAPVNNDLFDVSVRETYEPHNDRNGDICPKGSSCTDHHHFLSGLGVFQNLRLLIEDSNCPHYRASGNSEEISWSRQQVVKMAFSWTLEASAMAEEESTNLYWTFKTLSAYKV